MALAKESGQYQFKLPASADDDPLGILDESLRQGLDG
jgi:hypothetical protein